MCHLEQFPLACCALQQAQADAAAERHRGDTELTAAVAAAAAAARADCDAAVQQQSRALQQALSAAAVKDKMLEDCAAQVAYH
jgi:hypothetical protein